MQPNTGYFKNLTRPFGERARREIQTKYFVPLFNEDIPESFKQLHFKWQNFGRRMHYAGPVAWLVKAGFRLLPNAPQIGPCYSELNLLKNCRFLEEPTRDSLVFWIPQFVIGSTNKFARSQMAMLDLFRNKFNFPCNHLRSFGNATLLSGLILSYYRFAGVRVPQEDFFARTSTLTVGKCRFAVGWYRKRLNCELWRYDNERFPNVGFFAHGVESIAP